MVEVKIRWGSATTREDNGDTHFTYKFDTQTELEAFLRGVDEACGWMDYEIVGDE